MRSTVTMGPADADNGLATVQTASCGVTVQAQLTPTVPATAEPVTDANAPSISLPGGITLGTEAIAAAVAALCCCLLLIGGAVLLIGRTLTRGHRPVFPVWQPVYVPATMLNPATPAGARAGWQEHAASDALPSPCMPMDHAARKMLIGMDGVKLRNWRLDSLRVSQYDGYGRIDRTQVIAPPKLIRALNQQMEKSRLRPGKAPRRPESIIRGLGPSAAWIVNRFMRQLDRTAGLPIALDLRLTGDHGTVRIVFELYTCVNGTWQVVDAWEPEMMLRGTIIPENFSYTFYGRTPDETQKQFRRRLRAEIAQRLGLMMAQPQPDPVARPVQEPPVPAGSTAPSEPVIVSHPAPPPTQEIPRVPDAPTAPPAAENDPFTF